jgi:hypothetical protein
MKYIEKKEVIIYISDYINSGESCYYIGYLEHHTMSTNGVKFFSHYNFIKLEHIKHHPTLLNLLRSHKFKMVYTDLDNTTKLYKQIKASCISPIRVQEPTSKLDLIKDYQNLRGVIWDPKVSISVEIKETIEKFSSLIDLEKEFFPPEIRVLGKLSYLVK